MKFSRHSLVLMTVLAMFISAATLVVMPGVASAAIPTHLKTSTAIASRPSTGAVQPDQPSNISCTDNWGWSSSGTGVLTISYEGYTDCNYPLYSNGEACLYTGSFGLENCGNKIDTTAAFVESYGSYFPVVTCSSQILIYTISQTLPPGNTWTALPEECSGLGTPTRNCNYLEEFTAS